MIWFAYHLPTEVVSHKVWQRLPHWQQIDGEYPPYNDYFTLDSRGKAIRVHIKEYSGSDGDVSYAVRPIVRVKMGRGL